jgi:hypothetical protein
MTSLKVATKFARPCPEPALQIDTAKPTFRAMFDTIKAELTTAADKLSHLRRFL